MANLPSKADLHPDYSTTFTSSQGRTQLLSLDQLDSQFREIADESGGPRVRQAYYQAGLYARFFIEKITLGGIRQILNEVKGKIPALKAIEDATQSTVPQLEDGFRRWVKENVDKP